MARIKRGADEAPTREKIEAAAALVFSEVGYERTSMKALAKSAGVTPAALYYYYASKQELAYETLLRTMQHVISSGEAAVSGAVSPEHKLRAFVDNHVRVHLDQERSGVRTYNALVYYARGRSDFLSVDQSQSLRRLERRYLALLTGILEVGMGGGVFTRQPATPLALAIIGMLDHLQYWVRFPGPMSIDELCEFFVHQSLVLAKGAPAN